MREFMTLPSQPRSLSCDRTSGGALNREDRLSGVNVRNVTPVSYLYPILIANLNMHCAFQKHYPLRRSFSSLLEGTPTWEHKRHLCAWGQVWNHSACSAINTFAAWERTLIEQENASGWLEDEHWWFKSEIVSFVGWSDSLPTISFPAVPSSLCAWCFHIHPVATKCWKYEGYPISC